MDNIKSTMFSRTMFLLTRITFFFPLRCFFVTCSFRGQGFASIRSYTTIFFGYSTIIVQMIRHGKLFEETWLSVHNCILGCQLTYTVTLDMRFYSDTRGSKSYISDKFR